MLSKKIMDIFRPKPPSAVEMVLERVAGGVYKRLDENRELLELLQEKHSPLLEECPWIVGWLRSNDDFFAALEALGIATNPQFSKRPGFPRAWPQPPFTPGRNYNNVMLAAPRRGMS